MLRDIMPGMGCDRFEKHLKEKRIELPPFDYPLFDMKDFKSITAMKQPTGLKFVLENSELFKRNKNTENPEE